VKEMFKFYEMVRYENVKTAKLILNTLFGKKVLKDNWQREKELYKL
jgi:hypothetical protein